MPLFGGGEEKAAKKAAENAALHAERDRLSGLPFVDLAEEILQKVFTGEGEGAEEGECDRDDLAGHWDPTESIFGIDDHAKAELRSIVLEGVQVLEHACLVRWEISGSDYTSVNLHLTRVGRQALADGSVRELLGG